MRWAGKGLFSQTTLIDTNARPNTRFSKRRPALREWAGLQGRSFIHRQRMSAGRRGGMR